MKSQCQKTKFSVIENVQRTEAQSSIISDAVEAADESELGELKGYVIVSLHEGGETVSAYIPEDTSESYYKAIVKQCIDDHVTE